MLCGDCNDRGLAEKEHIVADYSFPDGSRGVIMDASYINKTPEEIREVEKNYQRVIWNIMLEKKVR